MMARIEQAAAETWWGWVCRGLAVAGFVALLISGFNVPVGCYFLLTGLFFGKEVVQGGIRFGGSG